MDCYYKLCTEFYDIDKPHPPADAMEFYTSHARQSLGPILEPMCGSGRFLVPLVAAGFDVDGTDASRHMLDACRSRAEAQGVRPTLLLQSLETLDPPRKYGLVIIPAGSFCLITEDAGARSSLARIHGSMLPGGKFVVEIERHKPQPSSSWPWGGRWVDRADGARIVISWLGGYDSATRVSRSVHRYELIKDGRLIETEFEQFDLRYYDPAEFAGLLDSAGFSLVRMLKAYEQREPDEADDTIVVECVRP